MPKCLGDTLVASDTSRSQPVPVGQTKLEQLLSIADDIVAVIDWFKSTKNTNTTTDITFDLPDTQDKDHRQSLRFNPEVWKMFKEFCTKHKQYSERDLLNQAVVDFVRRHS